MPFTDKYRLSPAMLGRCSGVVLICALAACGGAGSESIVAATPAPQVPAQMPNGTIRVEGSLIKSAGGKIFVMRGINLQYGDDPASRLAMIDEIADTGANTIRLELRGNTSAEQLRSALDRIVARGLVAVVMYWETDVTCTSSTTGFKSAMKHWTDSWKVVLSDPKYKANLILNIANEWGEADSSDTFGTTYRVAIAQLRAVGYQFPLMIDAAHCGQDYSVFSGGKAVQISASDPFRNVIFSTHAYWSYKTPAAIDGAIHAVQGQSVPFVWGEFGQQAFQIGNATDHRYLIQNAEASGIGYMAWSWYGNGDNEKVLDMRASGNVPILTTYGQEVVEGGSSFKGIRGTSVLLAN